MEPATPQWLRQRLTESFYGPCWHGPSLRAALRGVTAEMAVRKGLGRAHSIAELVGHLIFWQQDACLRLHGKGLTPTPARNFPAPDTAGPDWWPQLRAALAASQLHLLEQVDMLTPARLRDRAQGKSFTAGFMLAGLADHAIYHAGQIAILKKSSPPSRLHPAGRGTGSKSRE